MSQLDRHLSANFTLREFLRSATAERQPDVLAAQLDPPQEILDNLAYLCNHTLQPLRESIGYPMRISSGYRSPELNRLVGGSQTSQHLQGQAADVQLSDRFLRDPRTEDIRSRIERHVLHYTGEPMRPNVNANFYLFSFVCLKLHAFDIDQVIHEYGEDYGRPAWVHLAASAGDSGRRQILALGNYVDQQHKRPQLLAALSFGTDRLMS